MTLLTHIVVSGILQLGLIPGHTMALYGGIEYFETIDIQHTLFVDYQAEAVFWRHGFISGGFTSYGMPIKNRFSVYPFRIDYSSGAGFRSGQWTIGIDYKCDHPIAPYLRSLPLPLVNDAYAKIYIQIKIGGKS
jgi:hypothetical protein